MSLPIALHHRTLYRYDKAVMLGPQVVQLRPSPQGRTPILAYTLSLTPAKHTVYWQFDPLGNHVARVIFPERTTEFAVDINLIADLTPYNPFAFVLEPGFDRFPFVYPTLLARDLEPYRALEPAGVHLRALLTSLNRETQDTVGFLVALNARVRAEVQYTTRLEHGTQSCEETLEKRTGSCRDSAWLLVQICRQVGLAARFVSGYLVQLKAAEGETGPLVDSADLHAWTEVFLPGAGWIGMDPTAGLLAAEGHIPLVCTPTAGQAAPIGGTVEPSGVDFSFAMSVRRLEAAPERPEAPHAPQTPGLPSLAKPYSDEQWAQVRAVAHALDAELKAQDVRLTMGGEPTYVGIDEPESMQWNLDALGPIKRTRGLALIRCLRERTAPGAVLHFGQGKWYPNEALPRWAYHCISRVDGVPVWEDGALIANEQQPYGFGAAEALDFLKALARRLQVSTQNILPAFNPNAGPGPESGTAPEPAGYVLPLRRRQPAGRLAWSSQPWFERSSRLELSWGDSPIGYRIPVEPMPFVAPDELVYQAGAPFPATPERRLDLFVREPAPDPLPPLASTAENATELIRPALCVEAREGRLHVFLPYVPVAADYLDLIAAIEDTCRYLRKPVWLEGYPAPHDLRLRTFSLTPDPGVLEVNLPPTSDWDELETLNEILADEAHKNRLVPGKFAYDGSHLATGGGSHIVLGAATVPDSPLLRRPDLLRSMLAFWQNHPSLAYLFSGMYVGPTSQYPRVDEARPDALYELELAFSHIAEAEGAPSILDGLFRNLLVDVTGNTHRAEFCIDKMYPPEGLGLRLGLLELRAFEMAPHYRMGLMQMLLVRALVCAFWKAPFTGGLRRWDTALHDHFMLPHFVQQDFAEVLAHLARAGFALDEDWFAMHREFRFPKIGSLSVNGVSLELRQALEPWNVLAEETTAGGTGRSVDSSLERMQVKVTGLPPGGHYIVTCNGRKVPLHPTGVPGEAIAGIRYRARRLYAALHPTIPVHTPLVFDLVDTRLRRAVGRCTYFAGPPDGSVHTIRPADAAEAQARRMERFVVADTAPEAIAMPAEEHNPVFPMTLDLRWPAPSAQAGVAG